MKKSLTIIDTFGFLFRAYYALPSYLKSKKGFPTNMLTGFTKFISSLNSEYKTDLLLFALDSKGENFRKEIDSSYKSNRVEAPEDLLKQLGVAIEWIDKMGFKKLSINGYEADDIIASIAKVASKEGYLVKIVSHDKDLYQLIDDGKIVIIDPIKKSVVDELGCFEKYGVKPSQFCDYQALIGDSADNISGVKGIGPKNAQKLITDFHSIEKIYENINLIKPDRVKKLLIDGKESAFLSKKLVSLKDDLCENVDFREFSLPSLHPILSIANELLEYDIKDVLEQVKKDGFLLEENSKKKVEDSSFEAITVVSETELFTIIDSISKDVIVAFDTETNSLDTKEAKIVGFSFAFDEQKAYYVPINHSYLGVGEQISEDIAKKAIEKLLEYKVVGHNLKFDFSLLKNLFGYSKKDDFIDTMILSWLINPESKHSLDFLMQKYFDYEMKSFKDVVGKNSDFSVVSIDEATFYASEDAWAVRKLYFKLLNLLTMQDKELLLEAVSVEFPFINTLIEIENRGIKIDLEFFEQLSHESQKEISNITKEIYSLSGLEFNINSTQQLSHVLFDVLNLQSAKKTKTGFSTDEKVLLKLVDSHPIIEKVLDYRELFKLYSTYIEPLKNLAKQHSEHKIFTTFLQTGTATGRLSSKNPNLQNIPVRSDIGKKIRHGFIADVNKVLIGIDYSQIELRLLAHFSRDEVLVEAFNNNLDIHMQTAIKIFGKNATKDKRDIAKSINFGLLYGMGSKKLSETINISQKEAKEYINSYFASFPTVKRYIESIQESIKELGYVQTLLKRRRYFDFASANDFLKSNYLREGVNTLFQGSAADLIKLSMNEIINQKHDAKILLQIHDELIFECDKDKAEESAKILQHIMENIYKLNVPLKTSVNIANNWGDLK